MFYRGAKNTIFVMQLITFIVAKLHMKTSQPKPLITTN